MHASYAPWMHRNANIFRNILQSIPNSGAVSAPPKRKRAQEHKRTTSSGAPLTVSLRHRIYVMFGGKDVATRWFRFIFICAYIAGNVVIGTFNAMNVRTMIKDAKIGACKSIDRKCSGQNNIAPGFSGCCAGAFTMWVPAAKFFGGMMNLNFTLLLLPVSRSVITYLYNKSTGDQTTRSQIFRFFLKFIPIDQSLEFHKFCGWTGMIAALGHVVAHVMNYAQAPEQVWTIYGPGVWITGSLLLVIILLIATSVMRNVKRDHHELFMYTHMLYAPFILLAIFHGRNWLGPKYWKYFLFPGGVYILDKIYRHTFRSKECSVLGLTCMSNDVLVLRVDADSGPSLKGIKLDSTAPEMSPCIRSRVASLHNIFCSRKRRCDLPHSCHGR